MLRVLFAGLLVPLHLTGCFAETEEYATLECVSLDEQYAAGAVAIQSGGAAGAQFVSVYVRKLSGKKYRTEVLSTSTSDKMIMAWDASNNLLITVDSDVKIHKFKNYFDDVSYWNKKDSGRVSFQYQPFSSQEEVSLCVN